MAPVQCPKCKAHFYATANRQSIATYGSCLSCCTNAGKTAKARQSTTTSGIHKTGPGTVFCPTGPGTVFCPKCGFPKVGHLSHKSIANQGMCVQCVNKQSQNTAPPAPPDPVPAPPPPRGTTVQCSICHGHYRGPLNLHCIKNFGSCVRCTEKKTIPDPDKAPVIAEVPTCKCGTHNPAGQGHADWCDVFRREFL